MPEKKRPMKRREFVQFLSVLSAGGTSFGNTVLLLAQNDKRITREMIVRAEEVAGMRFTDSQRDLVIPTLQSYLHDVERLRDVCLSPETTPELCFLTDIQGIWTLNRGKSREG